MSVSKLDLEHTLKLWREDFWNKEANLQWKDQASKNIEAAYEVFLASAKNDLANVTKNYENHTTDGYTINEAHFYPKQHQEKKEMVEKCEARVKEIESLSKDQAVALDLFDITTSGW